MKFSSVVTVGASTPHICKSKGRQDWAELCGGAIWRAVWPSATVKGRVAEENPDLALCHSLGLLLVAVIGQTQPEGRVQGTLKWVGITGAEQGAEGRGGIWRQTG